MRSFTRQSYVGVGVRAHDMIKANGLRLIGLPLLIVAYELSGLISSGKLRESIFLIRC